MAGIDTLEIGLCWGTLVQARLAELIEAASRHGFPTLSVRPDMVRDTLGAGMSAGALRGRLRDAHVRVRVVDAIGAGLPGGRVPTPDAQSVVIGSAETCFQMAEAVGAPIVNICHYADWQHGPVLLPETIDAVGAISRAAERRAWRS